MKKAEDIHEIHQSVDIIMGISEQTNLLALNASIEAANDAAHISERVSGANKQSDLIFKEVQMTKKYVEQLLDTVKDLKV